MFQVILSSNSSLNNYPSNSGGCFHADLNETLHFNKFSWEVALSELIIIPNSWYLIREPFNYFYFRVTKLQMERLVLDSTYIRYDLKYKGGELLLPIFMEKNTLLNEHLKITMFLALLY